MTLFLKPAQGVALARAVSNLGHFNFRSVPAKNRGAALGLLLSDVYATEAVDRGALMRRAGEALQRLRAGRKQVEVERELFSLLVMDLYDYVRKEVNFEPFSPTHPDALQAMREIDADRTFRVFGFGEAHARKDGKGLTTLEHFAKSVLPYLVRERGITLLGLEHLPVDWKKDIGAFLRGDEGLESGESYRRRREQTKLLESIFSLRREGYSIALEGLRTPLFREFRGDLWPVREKRPREEEIQFINDRCEELILEAKRKGQSVALYNGFAHSASAPPINEKHYSYAAKMLAEGSLLPAEYLDIPLFVRGYFLTGGTAVWFTTYPEEYIMGRSAPTEGVYVRRWGENRVSIVFGGG